MKIRTPYYYKNFRCIAGECTDTCCAGWDVDVDAASYRFYKSVRGDFGKRLKSVMVADGEGGCTFTLTEDKRCPFLNKENLCDLYTALGEEHLCETCDEFPRFINEYGSTREIGIAPSCITAGQLMFFERGKMHFEETEDGKPPESYNDIDAFLYMQLNSARNAAFDITDNENFSTDEVCVILLEFARKIQKCMDSGQDMQIANVVKNFKDEKYCSDILKRCRKRVQLENVSSEYKGAAGSRYVKDVSDFFNSFKGMEVINPDWLKYVAGERRFESDIGKDDAVYFEMLSQFREYYKPQEFRFRQLLDYYIYRYFLDSVFDIDIVLKIKNAVVGYLTVRQLIFVCWHDNKKVTFDEYVDIAHLYSRQFEHSYINFEVYSEYFMKKRCYSFRALEGLLLL